MAESDGPSMPPQKKPKRESHFDSSVVLFPPPFYFVFDISNLLSYIQNNFSFELARPIMGTIFLVIIIIMNKSQELKVFHGRQKLTSAKN